MEPPRSDSDPFWSQFCERFQIQSVYNPRLYLWAGIPPPSAGFSCQQHAYTLALWALLTLCTLSHMLVLRRKLHADTEAVSGEGQDGEESTAGKESKRRHSGVPLKLRAKALFWFAMLLADLVGILWGAFAAWMVYLSLTQAPTAHDSDAVHLDQVAFAAGQALGWLVMGASFWACWSRNIHELFPTARVFMLTTAASFAAVVPFSAMHIIQHPVVSANLFFLEDALVLASLPVALLLGAMAYRGSTGLAWESPRGDPLMEPLLGRQEEEAVSEPKLSDTVTAFKDASLMSAVLFSYSVPVLERGADHVLTQDDIPQLRPADLSLPVFEKFDAKLQRLQAPNPERPPRIALTLFLSFFPILIATAVLALLQTCFIFAGPLLLPAFVDHVGSGDDGNQAEGLQLVLALLCASMLGSIFGTQQNFRGEILGLRIQSALVGALYQKGLRLSSKAKQESSIGEIVNYMSTDTQRLKDLCWELNNIWILPLQIVVALGILYHVVGVSMLAGLGVMLGIMLINLLVATQQQKSMAQTMDCKDVRMKATTEALKSMRVIKLYAWQEQFERRIADMRSAEMRWLARFMYICAVNIFLLWLSPLAVAVATFSTMILLGQPLTAGAVFSAIATFRILQEPLRSFPGVISAVTQALVSLKRLKEFLGSAELQPDAVVRRPATPQAGPLFVAPSGGLALADGAGAGAGAAAAGSDVGGGEEGAPELAVKVEDASFSWENDSGNMTLSKINLSVKRGGRVAICGAVGSGKSSLLSCLLGEVPKLQGKVTVWGTTAYVPQSAWIQNCTVRENILFGCPYDEAKYKETLRSCCLEKDLALFSHGDQTVIGERGVNLSGGQKQRIQLARAAYHGADVFLLDDPFSAVDAHTGSELFMEYILGALQGKTVILVTHQVEFLPAADLILVMKEGQIVQSGTFTELRDSGTDLAALVDAHEEALKSVDSASQLAGEEVGEGEVGGRKGKGEERGVRSAEESEEEWEEGGEGEEEGADGGGGQLIQDEEKESGHVSNEVYWAYVTKALGGALVPILLLIQLFWQALQIGSDYWLAAYTSGTTRASESDFLRVYSLLALGSGAFVFVRTMAISWAGLAITQSFYSDMLTSIFRAPMSYFDSTPIGRILARSSTDQGTLDLDIPFSFGSLLAMCFSLFGILFVCSFVTWPILFAIIPLSYLYLSFKEYYLSSSRELTRLNGITRAPIIEHFSESLAGAAVIRAFGQTERFAAKSRSTVDTNNRIYFHYCATTLWTAVHLQLIGSTLLCFTALMLISLPASVVTPGLAGMSLSYGLALSDGLFFVVWVWCALENEMVSVERIQQYSELPSESPLTLPERALPADWPSAGHIVFDKVEVRYRDDLPMVLKGVSLDIAAGSKLGVVGRTGSGKSTLVSALFRIVEPCGGSISIDGVNILAECGLADLRSRLSIIPQDPTLFEGTIRYNLDPLGLYSDADIWEALEKCQLHEAVQSSDEKLDSLVSEGGENWSVGQRQLFCLGRALLKKSRILVLDEATASVDSQTDALIQRTIRDNFAECTVISIAHRIPTVMDADKVLVMDQGVAAEYDSPSKLLEDSGSMFYGLVAEYSARSSGMVEAARSSSVENLASIR